MKTTYLRNKLLEHKTGKTTYTKPTNTYIGLFTSDPGADGDLDNEVAGGSYARQEASWAAAADGMIKIDTQIDFDDLPNAAIRYWGLFDSSSGDNLLEYYPFPTPILVPTGYDLSIDANNLILREA